MNKFVILGIIGTAGAIGFLVLRKKVGTNKPANSSAGSPRMDNASQPWYKNLMASAQGPIENIKKDPLGALRDSTTVIHSLSDITGTISGFFGGSASSDAQAENAAADAINADQQSGDQQGSADDYALSPDSMLPSSDIQQSNIFGVNTDYGNFLPDPSTTVMASSDSSWEINSNTADDFSDTGTTDGALGSDNFMSA